MNAVAPVSISGGPEMQTPEKIRVRLDSITYAAREINLFEFTPLDGNALPAAVAGAHIDLYLPGDQVRQYSLVLTGQKNSYTVGVKREPQGRGGSLYIHDSLRVGNEMEISAPRNNFPLREDATHSVFIAGGIGITPIWSMVHRLLEVGKSWELHYASRSPSDAAFFPELRKFPHAHFHFDCEHQMRPLALEPIVAAVPPTAHIYCCGPLPMLEAFERATADRPAGLAHVEYFTPRQEAAAGGFNVKLGRSGIEVAVPSGSSILEALLDAGITVPYSCTEGICGACQVGLLDGVPDHRDSVLTEEERVANNCIMVCCSGCKEGVLTLDL